MLLCECQAEASRFPTFCPAPPPGTAHKAPAGARHSPGLRSSPSALEADPGRRRTGLPVTCTHGNKLHQIERDIFISAGAESDAGNFHRCLRGIGNTGNLIVHCGDDSRCGAACCGPEACRDFRTQSRFCSFFGTKPWSGAEHRGGMPNSTLIRSVPMSVRPCPPPWAGRHFIGRSHSGCRHLSLSRRFRFPMIVP